MKKILSLFVLIILLFLSSCSKANVSTRIAPTISRYNFLENYYRYNRIIVTLTNEESLKFKNYTKEDFKLDNINFIIEVTDVTLDGCYNIEPCNFYKTQTMDNYKRKFRIYFDYSNTYDPLQQKIFDDADKILKEVDFVESAKVIVDTRDSYYNDRIFVTLTNEESLKFKEYTKDDFKLNDIETIDCFTDEDHVSWIKEMIETGNTKDREGLINRFRIVLELRMNYRDSARIQEDIAWLNENIDFIESARATFLNERIYYKDKIEVQLNREETLKFKDNYTKEDFKIDGIKEIVMDEHFLYNMSTYKEILEDEEEDEEYKEYLRKNIRASLTIYMDYEDEQRIVKDSEEILKKVDFVEHVKNSDMLLHSNSIGLLFCINHEESLKFKEYTIEDFEPVFGDRIYEVFDLTYVYKEIIESNNPYFDLANFHRMILVVLKVNGTYSRDILDEFAGAFDFVDYCDNVFMYE